MTIGLPILTILIIMTAVSASMFSTPNNPAPFMPSLLNKSFDTGDGALSIAVSKDNLMIIGPGFNHHPRTLIWRGGLGDELGVLSGNYKNCSWLVPTSEGLRDQDGTIFYAPNAPEKKVLLIMKAVAATARQFYSSAARYPNSEDIQPNRYTNPITKKEEDLKTYSMKVGKADSAGNDSRIDLDLRAGQFFNDEAGGHPGAVTAFAVSNRPAGSESGLPEQVGAAYSFYIHGYDRNGKLLTTVDKKHTHLIALKNGILKMADSSPSAYKTCDICLSAQRPPSQFAVFFKYLLLILAVAGALGFTVWSRLSVREKIGSFSLDQGQK